MWRAFWTWAGARIGGYRAQGGSILDEGKHQDGNKPRELMGHENSAVRAECYPIMGTRFGKEARLWRTLVESGLFKVGIKMFQTLLTSLSQWTSHLLHFKYIFYLNTRGLTTEYQLCQVSCLGLEIQDQSLNGTVTLTFTCHAGHAPCFCFVSSVLSDQPAISSPLCLANSYLTFRSQLKCPFLKKKLTCLLRNDQIPIWYNITLSFAK